VPGGETLVDTLLNGVAALAPDETRLLVATADIPFLTPDAVRDLLQRADAIGGTDFAYPIVEAARCREQFPEMKRTTLKIKEGEFTGAILSC
jgi:CTP:molybdopterin cytidylyltransferase MocA